VPAVAEVVEYLYAQVDAFVADRGGWPGDDLLDVSGPDAVKAQR
jgi:hypothetical protein